MIARLIVVFCVALPIGAACNPIVTVAANGTGVSAFTVGGASWHKASFEELNQVTFSDAATYSSLNPTTATRLTSPEGFDHTYRGSLDNEFRVVVTYTSTDCELRIDMTVYNEDDTHDLTGMNFLLLPFTLPGAADECPRQWTIQRNTSDFVAKLSASGWGTMAAWIGSYAGGQRLTVACGASGTAGFDPYFSLSAGESDGSDLTDPSVFTPIPAGGSRSFSAYYSFADEVVGVSSFPDPFATYATEFPLIVDRTRSGYYGSWFMAEAAYKSSTNPRGFLSAETDTTDQSAFNTAMLARADEIVARMNGLSPKPIGIMLWDIMGQEFVHFFTYVGDPTAIPAIVPEMWGDAGGVPLIKAIVQRFQAAGYDVGITIRPQQLVKHGTTLPATCAADDASTFKETVDTFVKTDATYPNRGYWCRENDDGGCTAAGDNWWCQYAIFSQPNETSLDDAVTTLKTKAQWAVANLGVYTFYIDSNNYSGTMGEQLMREVALANRNVLMIPEWETGAYYGSSIPYGELDANPPVTGISAGTPEVVWPARQFINIQDGDIAGNSAALTASARAGHIMMVRMWFTSPTEQNAVQGFYNDALEANGVVTLTSGERYETTLPLVERNRGSCHPWELAVRFAATTAALNACNPLLEQGCGSTTLCRSVDSPCTVADRTAHRLEIHNALQQACSVGPVQ